jgi:hypothetical protein
VFPYFQETKAILLHAPFVPMWNNRSDVPFNAAPAECRLYGSNFQEIGLLSGRYPNAPFKKDANSLE